MTLTVNVPEYQQMCDLAPLCLELVDINVGGMWVDMEERINGRQWCAGLAKIIGNDTVVVILQAYQANPGLPPLKLRKQHDYEPVRNRLK